MENGQENGQGQPEKGTEVNTASQEQQQAIPVDVAERLQALKGIINEDVLGEIEKGKVETEGKKPAAATEKKAVEKNDDHGAEVEEGNDKGDGKRGEEKPKKEKGADAAGEKKEKKDAEDKPSVFGLNKNKSVPVAIEKVEDAIELVNKKFGMSLKDVKDIPKFIESSEKWRADSQRLSEVEKEKENLTNIFENLPPEMIQGIKDFYEKGDYSEALANKPKFDYKKDVKDIDTKKLVEAYFPGKFADEDFKEETPPPALEIAITAARDKYSAEKKAKEEKLTRINQEASDKLNARKESIKSSVENLKQSFPNMDDKAIKQIEKVLESGDVNSLYFNKKGAYEKSAAKRVAFAIFTDELLNEAMGVAANQAESRHNEEMLTRGADKKSPVKTNSGADEIPKELKEKVQEITRLGTKKMTF